MKVYNASSKGWHRPKLVPACDLSKEMVHYTARDLYNNMPAIKARPMVFEEELPASFEVISDHILSPFSGAFQKLLNTVNLSMEMAHEDSHPVCDYAKTDKHDFIRENRQTRLPFYWTKI